MATYYSNSFNVPVAQAGGDPLTLPRFAIAQSGGPYQMDSDANIEALFSYDGGFSVDDSEVIGGNGSTVHDGKIYVGRKASQNFMVADLPAIGGTAPITAGPSTISGSVGDPNNSTYITASHVHVSNNYASGKLFIAKTNTYNSQAEYPYTNYIQVGNPDLTGFSSSANIQINGTRHGLTYGRILSTAMGSIPAEWQSTLGGDTFIFGARYSVIGSACAGYGMGAFWGDELAALGSGGGTLNVRDWLWYAGSNSLEPVNTTDNTDPSTLNSIGGQDYFVQTNAFLATAFIIPGTRTLCFVTPHAYGADGNQIGCAYESDSSTHNSPLRLQAIVFDLADIVGAVNAWDAFPYGWGVLPGYGVAWDDCTRGFHGGCGAYDPANKKVYFSNGSSAFRRWTLNA